MVLSILYNMKGILAIACNAPRKTASVYRSHVQIIDVSKLAGNEQPMAARSDDDSFWLRQDSVSPQNDHPSLSSTPSRPRHPDIELLITTPAGKSLFYFAYNRSNRHHPDFSQCARPSPRPDAAISSLSATLTAFQAATQNTVSVIKTSNNTLLTHVHNALHVALLARHHPAPLQFLQALIRIAIVSICATLSASFSTHLIDHPTSRPSLARAEPLLNAILLDALTHPLSYVLQRPISLPSHVKPSTRISLTRILRQVLIRHENITHILLFTTGPPLPVRLVASCSRANNELSGLDLLLLGALPCPSEPSIVSNIQFFPHSKMFHVGSDVFSKVLFLRLHPDHHDMFKSAVGGRSWRPEWTQASPHTLRLIALGHGDPTSFVNALEETLDRSLIAAELLINMELPLFLNTFGVSGARALITIHKESRIGGTVNAFSYPIAMSCLTALYRARSQKPVQKLLVTSCPTWKLRVVSWYLRYLVCFDMSVPEATALAATENVFVPWLERYQSTIVPEGEHITIHPRTPLAGLMAPFEN